jgi:hypothetical protein
MWYVQVRMMYQFNHNVINIIIYDDAINMMCVLICIKSFDYALKKAQNEFVTGTVLTVLKT